MMLTAMSEDCEIWTKGTTGYGYPTMKRDGRSVYVKPALWKKASGPIPEGMTVRSRTAQILHVCEDMLTTIKRDRERDGQENKAQGAGR